MHWYWDENFCWPFKGYSRPRLTRLALHTCVFKTYSFEEFCAPMCKIFLVWQFVLIAKFFSSQYWWGVNSYNDYRFSPCFIPQFFRSFLCLPVLLYRFSISVCLINAIENKDDYKLVILNVNCVCYVLHRSVRRCHGRVCGESWYSEG